MLRKLITALTTACILTAAPAFAQGTSSQSQSEARDVPSQRMGPGMMGNGMMGSGITGQGMMGSGITGQGMMGSGAMMNRMSGMAMGEHVEGRLAFLKTELKITEAQEPQWDAFAEAIRANAKSMAAMHQSMSPRRHTGPLPERLAHEDRALTRQLSALKKTEDTLDKLYGVLSADQKKMADTIVIGPMGMPTGMM